MILDAALDCVFFVRTASPWVLQCRRRPQGKIRFVSDGGIFLGGAP
jgi:hypothetical protein